MEDNNVSDDLSTIITYDGHLCNTTIPGNAYLSSNKIPEIRDLDLYSFHIDVENTVSTPAKNKPTQISPFKE